MDACRQDVRKLMKREGGLQAEHTCPIVPEPENHEILMIPGGEVDDPVNAAADPDEPPTAQVLGEQLW